jgi:hypothetical protein
MKDAVTTYMPYLLSVISIAMTLMAGNLHKRAWILGAIAQLFWFVWIIVSENWGFLPMNVVFFFVYLRNHYKWKDLEIADSSRSRNKVNADLC